MNTKEQKLRKIIREELKRQLNEGKFWRASKKSIGNELYSAQKSLVDFYETLKGGNDLDMKHLDSIISKLQKVKKAAKQFSSPDELTDDYK
jgi:hypothetical protein